MRMGVLFVIVGGLATALGVFGKDFYVADIITLSSFKKNEKMARWLGRLIFILGGVLFVALGMKFLVDTQ